MAFARARAEGRAALVPFVTAGFPDASTSLELLVGAADAGADVLELGVPFSDPVADGPVIQRASQRALAGGMSLSGALEIAAAFRARRSTPLLLFSYLNPILRRGVEASGRDLARAGAHGLLVCDLPVEEAAELRACVRGAGLDWVALVAPTSTPARLRSAAESGSGFLYLIARTGVTWLGPWDPRLAAQMSALRHLTDLPLAVGFGIASAEAARAAATVADGVVVGSAFLERVGTSGAAVGLAFLRGIRTALEGATARPAV